MTTPARVGVLGCGMISRAYADNASAFDAFELVTCADLDASQAEALSGEHGLRLETVDELLADPEVDVVLNLTPPAVHAAVVRDALAADKHVYSEKPLATAALEAQELVEEAARRGLRIGCAPDTFLGAPYQAGRRVIDEGAIGRPLSVSAAMLVGAIEEWHPNPDIFFGEAGGPLLDMGPYYLTAIVALLGPVRRVAGFTSTPVAERTIGFGPRTGEVFEAATPTHVAATLELESGVTANLVTSFEAPALYVCDLVIHGTEGVLALPDPNGFGGPVRVRRGRGEWEEVPFASRGGRDARGIGLDDMSRAISDDRLHRASGEVAVHVVDIARSTLRAAQEGRTIDVESTAERPEPLADGAAG